MDDIALSLSIETAGMLDGLKAVIDAQRRTGDAAVDMEGKLTHASVGPTDAMRQLGLSYDRLNDAQRLAGDQTKLFIAVKQQELAATRALIQLDLTNQWITQTEATKRLTQATQEYNAALVEAQNAARYGTADMAINTAAVTQLSGALVDMSDAAGGANGAHMSFGRLGYALAGFGSRAASINPILGHMLYIFGSFGIGTTLMIGVLAGFVAIVGIWQQMTEESRKLEKAIEDVTKKLSSQRDATAAPYTDYITSLDAVIAKQKELTDTIAGSLTKAQAWKAAIYYLTHIPQLLGFGEDKAQADATAQAQKDLNTAIVNRKTAYTDMWKAMQSAHAQEGATLIAEIELGKASAQTYKERAELIRTLQVEDTKLGDTDKQHAARLREIDQLQKAVQNGAKANLKDEIDAGNKVAEMWDKVRAAQAEANDPTGRQKRVEDMKKLVVEFGDFAGVAGLGYDEVVKFAAALKQVDATKSANEVEKLTMKYGAQRDQAQGLYEATLQGTEAVKRYTAEAELQNEIAAVYATDIAPAEKEAIEGIIRQWLAARNATISYNAAQEKLAKDWKEFWAEQKNTMKAADEAAKKLASITEKPFKDMIHGVGNAFAKFFEDVFKGGANLMQKMADTIRQIFAKLLADLISMKFTQMLQGTAMGVMLGMPTASTHQTDSQVLANTGNANIGDPMTGAPTATHGGSSLQGGLGAGLAGFGVGYGIGSMTTNPALGALGGALGGAAIGTMILPGIGTIVGAVAGLIGGLLGSAEKAKEAAKAMAEASRAFGLAMDDFMSIAHPRSDFDTNVSKLKKMVDDLQKAAAAKEDYKGKGTTIDVTKTSVEELERIKATAGTNEAAKRYIDDLIQIRKAYDDNVAALKVQDAELRQATEASYHARMLAAQGHDAEAALADFDEKQRQEMQALQKKGNDLATTTQVIELANLQYAERKAFLEKQQAAINEKAITEAEARVRLSSDLTARELKLKGDTMAADQEMARQTARDQIAAAEAAFRAGQITAETLNRLKTVIGGELDAALKKLAEDAKAAAAAITAYNVAAQQDAQVRTQYGNAAIANTNASIAGDPKEAQAFRDEARYWTQLAEDTAAAVAHQRELDAAVKAGATQATIDAINLAYATETLSRTRAREAAVLQSMAAAEQARTDRLQAEKRATDDLNIRDMAAAGNDWGAQLARFKQGQADELARDKKDGMSADFISHLMETQGNELRKFIADHNAQIAANLTQTAATAASTNFRSSIASITTTQADTMNAYLASISVNTAVMARTSPGAGVAGVLNANNINFGQSGSGIVMVSLTITDIAPGQTVGQATGIAVDRALGKRANLASNASGASRTV